MDANASEKKVDANTSKKQWTQMRPKMFDWDVDYVPGREYVQFEANLNSK